MHYFVAFFPLFFLHFILSEKWPLIMHYIIFLLAFCFSFIRVSLKKNEKFESIVYNLKKDSFKMVEDVLSDIIFVIKEVHCTTV